VSLAEARMVGLAFVPSRRVDAALVYLPVYLPSHRGDPVCLY
jgi:hypothetical protein